MLKKNKSIALVMILALLIITSSCAPKNTQAEIDKPAKQVPLGRGNFADQNLISSVLTVMIRHFTQKS